jgi:tetratricopeptide (TPR) repeat protein
MTWVLPEPAKRTEKELLQWANGQIGHGVPRQVVWNYLLDWENRKLSSEEKEASMKMASCLLDVMVDRNLNGKTLEAAGEIDKAIALYEENVSDLFDGDHPYDRLRVIYTKRKQFAEAIRVCRSFVIIADMLIEEGSGRSDLKPKRDKFISWIEKLEKNHPEAQND